MTDRETGSPFSSHEERGLKGIEKTSIKKAKYLLPQEFVFFSKFQLLEERKVKTPKHAFVALSDEGLVIHSAFCTYWGAFTEQFKPSINTAVSPKGREKESMARRQICINWYRVFCSLIPPKQPKSLHLLYHSTPPVKPHRAD